jgi:hypothetical protein
MNLQLPPSLMRHLFQPISHLVLLKSYVDYVFVMIIIFITNNVLAAIRKMVELTILDGNIYVSKTSRHSNAETTVPSQGGTVVFL